MFYFLCVFGWWVENHYINILTFSLLSFGTFYFQIAQNINTCTWLWSYGFSFFFFYFASHIFPFYAQYNSSINPTTNNPCLLLHVFMILYLSTYTHNTTYISIIINIYKLNLSPCLPYKKSYLEFLKNSILK